MIVYEPAVELKLPRAARPRRRELTRFLRQAVDATGLAGDVSVLLTGDAALRSAQSELSAIKIRQRMCCLFPLLKRYGGRGRRSGDLAGDGASGRQRSASHTLEMEIKVLVLHGLLHLAGYDHETDNGTMRRKEVRLRRELGLTAALIERAYRDRAQQRRAQVVASRGAGA